MTETERISVAEASAGFGGSEDPGTEISLPVVELLTGRGFVTGKSGSGKSNSASVIAEKLLDNGFGILIVDIDGEYYGLKEEYEILHAGADEECDIQIDADHAEKLATLALEQNVPIILDVSSFLDEDEAEEVLTAVSRHLFAKAKKQKQPFLLLVEEVHEYIPEKGSVGECGKMLIKIGKRGRKHGLGICGISQRPADVKKDFITQCDWLLWHRLTWNNDTKVVGRILDNEYASAIEDLDDGEGFLMTDWAEAIHRVQFFRKQTFDAGATPGLDDFERPELKSVSDDLVSELEEISDEKQQRESQIAELREELDRKNSRIAELERELQDARDLSRMAEQFVDSLVTEVKGTEPGKTERQRMRESYAHSRPEKTPETESADESVTAEAEQTTAFGSAFDGSVFESDSPDTTNGQGPSGQAMNQQAPDTESESQAAPGGNVDSEPVTATEAEQFEEFSPVDEVEIVGGSSDSEDETAAASTDGESKTMASTDGGVSDADSNGGAGSDFSAEAVMNALNSVSEIESEQDSRLFGEEFDGAVLNDAEFVANERDGTGERRSGFVSAEADSTNDAESLVIRELKAEIAGLQTKTRKMLSVYRDEGPETPLNAHFAAGGDGTRTDAYAHNRRLRTRGLIEHVGRGYYEYSLRERLEAELGPGHDIDAAAEAIESAAFDST